MLLLGLRAQVFDAHYVGVIWGRDLIWRNNGWTVNPGPITDYVGGRFSLRSSC
ncbi:DNA/RNA helicase domain-containing protein [Stygiolobus sp. CP850M]|uniref:DNA/RNA helicase domain-containing protein n=1 Tax=Stygiolobus sp. CP850M TaxID=3133134 RepID=UPI00307E9C85